MKTYKLLNTHMEESYEDRPQEEKKSFNNKGYIIEEFWQSENGNRKHRTREYQHGRLAKITPDNRDLPEQYSYDTVNNVVKMEMIENDESFDISIRKYNSHNRLVGSETVPGLISLCCPPEKIFIEYDSAEREVKRTIYHYDTILSETWHFHYSANHYHVYTSRTGDYNGPGKREQLKFNNKDQILEKIEYTLQGSLVEKSVWKYDTLGNEIENQVFDNRMKPTEHYITEYQYDSAGNWTLLSRYAIKKERRKLLKATYRTIEYW